MKNRLIYKFILSFAAATLVAFLVMSYVIPKITLNKALQSESDKLYVKATSIASDYGTEYFQTAPNLPESEPYSMLSANISDVI